MSRASFGFVLPCRASNIRGQLKHTYLTNKVCLTTLPEDLMESMLFKEHGIPQNQVIRRLISELLEVMGSMEDGFSPAQLVNQLKPFRELPSENRQILRDKIHRQFVQKFWLDDRRMRLEQASTGFVSALDLFLSEDQTDLTASKAGMDKVQEAARDLIRELETLPKGVWLCGKQTSETLS